MIWVSQFMLLVVCFVCNIEQQVAQLCSNCVVNMVEYYCDICKFFDDDVSIFCIDCNTTSHATFHIFWHKCINCNSYNTRVIDNLQIINDVLLIRKVSEYPKAMQFRLRLFWLCFRQFDNSPLLCLCRLYAKRMKESTAAVID